MRHAALKSLVLMTCLGLVTPALAQSQEGPSTITAGGHGEARAVPDMAQFFAGVRVEAPTASAALAAANMQMKAVLGALRKTGVPDGDVGTRNFSLNPQYAPDDKKGPRLSGYQVNNQVEVKLEDVARLGAVLDALAAAGANEINGVRFAFKDPASLEAQAEKAAVAAARQKAEVYAEAAGVSLGKLLSLKEGGSQTPRPLFGETLVSGVPMMPGEESVGADVTLVFAIK